MFDKLLVEFSSGFPGENVADRLAGDVHFSSDSPLRESFLRKSTNDVLRLIANHDLFSPNGAWFISTQLGAYIFASQRGLSV